ncbi:MAG: DsbA family protein [Pseudomonadota bacterium]
MINGLFIRAMIAASLLVTGVSASSAFEDAERAEIGEIVREYLLANPEILIEMQEEIEARAAAEEEKTRTALIESSRDALFRSPKDPVLGNPDGDVTIVEFFDYNCGFCRRAMADMEQIIATDDNVRFVLKEFPILGQESIEAHQVALAFNQIAPEKYAEFHSQLMNFDGRANEESAISIAIGLGVDADALQAAIADPSHSSTVQQTYQIAQGLGITGTPSYVVGTDLIPGALGVNELRARIEAVRARQ